MTTNHCATCGTPIPAIGVNGRPRTYCTHACHYRSYARDPHQSQGEYRIPPERLDEMAIVRLISGERVESSKTERLEATRILTTKGHSASWIADFLHITERTVTRYRRQFNTQKVAA